MTFRPRLLLATMVAAGALFAGSAGAQTGIAQIPIPGAPLTAFDVTYVDEATQRLYLADRSNKAIDIIDAKTDKYIGRVGGYVGLRFKNGKPSNEISGPNGVIAFGDEAWTTDGDSTIKVIDLKAMKIVDTIKTGGEARADEGDYDPKDGVIIYANGDDDTPFVTLISTKPGHKIIGKISYPEATDGIEASFYNPADGMFYTSLPEIKGEARNGAIVVIDPNSAKEVRRFDTRGCHQNGIALGPNQNIFLGCTAHGKEGMEAKFVIMNASGATVAEIPGAGGADIVAYSKTNNQYYAATSNNPTGHALVVVDAGTNKTVPGGIIPILGGAPHSVAVNDVNGHVYLPVSAKEGGCGCVLVFGGPL